MGITNQTYEDHAGLRFHRVSRVLAQDMWHRGSRAGLKIVAQEFGRYYKCFEDLGLYIYGVCAH